MDSRWLNAIQWFNCELIQCKEEGKDVSKYENIELNENNIFYIYEEMYKLPISKDFEFDESNDFEKIVINGSKDTLPYDKEKLQNKIKAAWYGRVIGNELGKPVEGLSRASIKEVEIEAKNYPLTDYLNNNNLTDEWLEDFRVRNRFRIRREWLRNGFDFARWDDDLNYTVINMLLLEKFGRDFKPQDVITMWTSNFPISALCTAEKIAYKNAILNMEPPQTAIYANPFREWVGAAIRGDVFGYVNPGNPYEAARMAYNDACVSHIKNGIYAEILVSVLTSLAFSINDPLKLVTEAIKYIPNTSRLYKNVVKVIDCYKQNKTIEDATNLIHSTYDEKNTQHAVHAIPNCMVIVASILFAKNDFDKALAYSIDAAYDTDSNTAIVASIVGIMNGFESINPKWYELFNGILETKIIEVGTTKIDSLVERTLKI